MSTLRRMALGWLVAALAALPAAAADTDPYAAVHRVAIVSTLGDGLTLKRDADLFGPTDSDIVIPTGAGLDGFVAARLRAALQGRFEIVAQSENPDALIVVHAAQIDQHLYIPPISATFHYSGLSATRSEGLFGAHSILLSAQYAVSVIDAKTGKEIGYGQAKSPATGIFGARPDPIEVCKDGFWPAAPDRPSEEERAQIGADLTAIVAMSLPNALQRAGLATQGNDIKLDTWDGRPLLCHEMG